jgi:alpha-tubulin suppressor-like RCC1 family protein
MRHARLLLLSCAAGLAACSLAGLDHAVLPVCATDGDCAALAARVDDPDCDTFVCVPETGRCMPATVDADSDGEPPIACGGTDCDDADAARFAAATEICNGIDDDCDDLLDGPDEDDDHDRATDLCGGPAVARDCDDTDPFTYFNAPELCDGIDDDCLVDGVARQSGGRRPEPSEDADGDGHAAVDAACVAGPSGDPRFFALDDCDDTRAEVFPGAEELCDGLDNDCDGVLDDATGTTEPGTTCIPTGLLVGGRGSCVRTGHGDLVCWGSNREGQLGDLGAPDDAAIVVTAAEGLSGVSLGEAGGCGVTSTGDVRCWGGSYLFGRELSTSFGSHAPGTVTGVETAVEVSVGASHACARLTSGEISCWGFPCPGSFVDGTTRDCTWSIAPALVPGIDDATKVDAGGLLTCALRASGEVWCWGFNFEGLVGTGSTAADAPPAAVTGIDDAVDVFVGGGIACALRASGELWCWGENPGCVGSTCAATIPVARSLPLAGTVSDVVLGGGHGCVLYEDETFACWGRNDVGQLAILDPSVAGSRMLRASSTTGVLELGLGTAHTCARTREGVRCWGEGGNRQLGDGRSAHTDPPYLGFIGNDVSVIANAMQIAGGSLDTCFRMPDLSIACAGTDTFGELPGAFGADHAVPAFGDVPARDIALGAYRTCVVRTDGRVNCYGDTRYAAAGTADADGYLAGVSDAVDAACGSDHCCLLRATGEVVCLGLGRDGRLGNGGATVGTCFGWQPCTNDPVTALGLERAVVLAAGGDHTCAIRDDGTIACWGGNARGQTGSVPLGSTSAPTDVEGLPPGDRPVGLALSSESSCAVLASGAVWCWGEGFGPASGSFSVDPLPLEGIANIVQIAATGDGLCVRQRSGVVRCMGGNAYGQLGDGTRTASSELRSVLGLTDARDLGCGGGHCCATRTSGQTVCWGHDDQGQLGTEGGTDRLRATATASLGE